MKSRNNYRWISLDKAAISGEVSVYFDIRFDKFMLFMRHHLLNTESKNQYSSWLESLTPTA